MTLCQMLQRPPQCKCCRSTCIASGAGRIPLIDLQHSTTDHVQHLDMALAAEDVVSHLPSPTTKGALAASANHLVMHAAPVTAA